MCLTFRAVVVQYNALICSSLPLLLNNYCCFPSKNFYPQKERDTWRLGFNNSSTLVEVHLTLKMRGKWMNGFNISCSAVAVKHALPPRLGIVRHCEANYSSFQLDDKRETPRMIEMFFPRQSSVEIICIVLWSSSSFWCLRRDLCVLFWWVRYLG